MSFARLLFPLGLLLLTGCQTVRYEYTPPVTPEGRQCVVQCSAVREMCRANENQRADYKEQMCEERSEHTYYMCMKRAGRDAKQQEKCSDKRMYCKEYADVYHCNDEYNQCFTICGGSVNTIIEK